MTILKLVVIAARALKDPHIISKMKPFTAVYVVGLIPNPRIETSPQPGHNPVWSFRMELELPETKIQQNSLTLVFQILSKNKLGNSREIGKVVVPVKDLLDSRMTGNNKKTLQVTTPSGEFQGELTFSYEFSDT